MTGPTMDLIEAVAAPLPLPVVCEPFGSPPGDRPQVKAWFRRFGRLTEGIDRTETAIDEYEEYLGRLVRRRADPGDDLVGNTVLALLRHPDQLARLQEDPGLIRTAVEELSRYDTPTQAIPRVVAEDIEIGGRTLREGELVYLFLAAANRDPERFEDPTVST
ncbi:cytochrome P450 [Streptomyces sp. HUAS TT3]|uniref:cytochrome P450 n=1 Tax=Streptomyces sp. HUAS TT3 TaxID=3447510 RepID=UPI003F655115